ncbi:hypothetical protein Hdeb2414_s0001g00015401 [Helianthus debilis subsp. tardiflorus]
MSDEAQYSDSGEHHSTVTDNPNSNTKASATVDDLPPEPTTTVTTADDDSNNSSTSSQMANGLSYTISTIIRDFDTQAQHTSRSQDQLSSAIDRLTNDAFMVE